jgi:hypothetical protein
MLKQGLLNPLEPQHFRSPNSQSTYMDTLLRRSASRVVDTGAMVGRSDASSRITNMTEMPMSLPLDKDGFLRRECPHCERQFKWWPTPTSEEISDEAEEVPEAYFCPYCHEPAPLDAWWTKEQLEYAQQLAAAEVLGPELRRMKGDLESGNRRSGMIRFGASMPSSSRPEPLTEPDDMVRVDVPCHPEDPIKVDEEWEGEVACLICGIRYPVELVRALPEEEGGSAE